ncbi:MAG: hypothetical protein ACXVCY_06105 [Pseudobdellovibrionaceae bacterium]
MNKLINKKKISALFISISFLVSCTKGKFGIDSVSLSTFQSASKSSQNQSESTDNKKAVHALSLATNSEFLPKTGIWLNSQLNGTGLAVEVSPIDGKYLVASFYYDKKGTPRWSIMGLSSTEASTYAGSQFTISDYLQTVKGGRVWDLSAPTPSTGISVQRDSTNPVEITFTNPTHGAFGNGWGTWTNEFLDYLVFASGTPNKTITNGWYIDSVNSPWSGYFIVQQGTQLYLVIATYDENHEPIWGLSNLTQTQGNGSYLNFSGTLNYLTGGNPFGSKINSHYTSQNIAANPVKIEFSSANNANLILPNGNKVVLERLQLSAKAPSYCSDPYYKDIFNCKASNPTYCSDSYYKDAVACFASNPSYCSDPYYKDATSCVGSNPPYCSDQYYKDANSCIGSNPSYCSDPYYKDAKSCNSANPSYCSDPYYKDAITCVGSRPSYCSDPYYKDAKSCNGSNPSYCSDPYYKDSSACFGAKPSYCSDPYYKDANSCNRSNPSYCSDPYYKDAKSCVDSNPSYCSDPYYKDARSCMSTHPSYCSDPYYKDSGSCIGANPSYCANPYYSNATACSDSFQGYCSDPYYRDAKSCLGSNPLYCSNPVYKDSIACTAY